MAEGEASTASRNLGRWRAGGRERQGEPRLSVMAPTGNLDGPRHGCWRGVP